MLTRKDNDENEDDHDKNESDNDGSCDLQNHRT